MKEKSVQYRAVIEAMPSNPAAKRIGDQSGSWRIVIQERVEGRPTVTKSIYRENLSYQEAEELAPKIEEQLNQSN